MEQHALGRIDAQALEQLRIAQRQFDHFAQLVDRAGHAADIVIGDVGAAHLARLLIFGPQLDFGVLVDVHDALGSRGHDGEADFLQRIGGGIHKALDGRVRHALMSGGRHHVALADRPSEEGALQRVAGPLKAQVLLGRREHHSRRRLRLDTPYLDEVARAHAGVRPLQAVEPDQIETLVLAIGADRAGGCRPLADDLDHVSLGKAERGHQGTGKVRDAATAVLRPRIRNLYPARLRVVVGHRHPFTFSKRVREIGSRGRRARRKKKADREDRP